MNVTLDEFEEVVTVSADDRGRVTLGQDYAGEDVQLVVVRTDD